jgi:hypothetical protein
MNINEMDALPEQLPTDDILPEADDGEQTAVDENAQQPQQLDYDTLLSLGKREREEDSEGQLESGGIPPNVSIEAADAKRRKTQEEVASEKKLNNENWDMMYQRLVAFKVRIFYKVLLCSPGDIFCRYEFLTLTIFLLILCS